MKQSFQKHFDRLKHTENHRLRKVAGVLLVIGGALGFLPILGYWMLPLGLALLATDFPLVRRLNRRCLVWWERQRRRLRVSRVDNPAPDPTRRREKPQR